MAPPSSYRAREQSTTNRLLLLHLNVFMNTADTMDPPIDDCFLSIHWGGGCDEESTIPAEEDLQPVAVDAIIMKGGVSRNVRVRIRLLDIYLDTGNLGEVVVPTYECAKANDSSIPAEECAKACAKAEESSIPEEDYAKARKRKRTAFFSACEGGKEDYWESFCKKKGTINYTHKI